MDLMFNFLSSAFWLSLWIHFEFTKYNLELIHSIDRKFRSPENIYFLSFWELFLSYLFTCNQLILACRQFRVFLLWTVPKTMSVLPLNTGQLSGSESPSWCSTPSAGWVGRRWTRVRNPRRQQRRPSKNNCERYSQKSDITMDDNTILVSKPPRTECILDSYC